MIVLDCKYRGWGGGACDLVWVEIKNILRLIETLFDVGLVQCTVIELGSIDHELVRGADSRSVMEHSSVYLIVLFKGVRNEY